MAEKENIEAGLEEEEKAFEEDMKEETESKEAEDPEEETEGAEEEPEESGEEAPESEEPEEGSEKKDEKLHIFKNKKKKKDKKDAMIEELNDRVKRQMAEFENFRKRSEKEKTRMYDMGASSMVEKILPAVDSFERGLAGREEEDDDPFAEGMRMVYKQLMTALEEAGVKPIEAVGKEFDPELHNAVMHIDDEEYGENEIVEELQKGYTYHDAVVRHSMVKVAN